MEIFKKDAPEASCTLDCCTLIHWNDFYICGKSVKNVCFQANIVTNILVLGNVSVEKKSANPIPKPVHVSLFISNEHNMYSFWINLNCFLIPITYY